MSRPCVGYCGGHYPMKEMKGTDEGQMCRECYNRLLAANDGVLPNNERYTRRFRSDTDQ